LHNLSQKQNTPFSLANRNQCKELHKSLFSFFLSNYKKTTSNISLNGCLTLSLTKVINYINNAVTNNNKKEEKISKTITHVTLSLSEHSQKTTTKYQSYMFSFPVSCLPTQPEVKVSFWVSVKK